MDLLTEIKTRLSVTGDFHNEVISGFAEDVKHFMQMAGVKKSVVDSEKSIGAISRGVADLWTGNGIFSEVFKLQVIQLTFEEEIENVQTEDTI